MAFSSIVFLFIFFPAVFLLYILFKNSWYRNSILLVASLVFFAWADLGHVHILVLSVLLNYGIGRLLEDANERQKNKLSRVLIWSGLAGNLGILFFYKYLGFFDGVLMAITGASFSLHQIALPLGLSYFTFSGISYLIDVHQGVEKGEKNFLRFSNYMLMFPKLLQGPITRFGQVKNELVNTEISWENVAIGIRRLILGLAKKILLADTMATVANRVFQVSPERYGVVVAWTGIIAYTLQIYFDFSGYTDMAIGIGRIFGFRLPENFNYPYISRSISEFWRRWHMTLTAWFRTYVFIPLEFLHKKQKFLRQQTNLVIVFLLTGLWHGAGWNYVIWGLYFGVILAIESGSWGKTLKKVHPILQHAYTSILIIAGWGFFALTDMNRWKPFFSALFGFNGWSGTVNLRSLNVLAFVPMIIISVLFSTPILGNLQKKIEKNEKIGYPVSIFISLFLFFLSIAFLISKGYTAFIYAQF